MRLLLRVLGGLVGAVALLLFAIFVYGRFSDGPVAFFSGGPLRSGELVTREPDWSFVRHVDEVELQLLEPARSRTVWIVEHGGKIYVPCGVPEFRLWKQWPHEAMADGRAVLRVEGKRYPRQAVRVTDPKLHATLAQRVVEKYGLGGAAPGPDDVWFFRMDPRPAS